jgi:hypothetical protein
MRTGADLAWLMKSLLRSKSLDERYGYINYPDARFATTLTVDEIAIMSVRSWRR